MELHQNWKDSRLMISHGLGHRRILRDKEIITQILDFMEARHKLLEKQAVV
jgi:hypothetical protein